MNFPKIQKFYVCALFKSNQTHDNITAKSIFKNNLEIFNFYYQIKKLIMKTIWQ